MNKSVRSEIEGFSRQLNSYSLIIKRNKDRLEEDSWLEKQITFWMESSRFLILELEIWDQLDNTAKCDETIQKAQKALDHMYELLRELT